MVKSVSAVSSETLAELDARAESVSSAAEARELLAELERLKRHLEVTTARLVDRVSVSGCFQEDGCLSVATWLRTTVNWPLAEAKRMVRVADFVHHYPQVGASMADGLLASAPVTRLAALHANKRVTAQLPDFIDSMVEYAQALPCDDFAHLASRWEQLADADGTHRSHERVHDDRDATVNPVGNATYLDARLGNGQGALITEVFERFVQAELSRDLAERDALGLSPTSLSRTPKQRRADALYAVFAAAATRFAPAPEPLVNIVIDQRTYERTLSAMETGSRLGSLVEPGENLLDTRCETTAGVLLDPVDVVATSLVSHVRRVVVTAAGVPIGLGRRSRLFTGGTRAAALLRRRRCIWPGCHVLTCDVDHRVPWAQGGGTDVENSDPLCRRHNRLKTHGYITHYDEATRSTRVITPDGRPLTPV
ncbi:MAG: hypothetical protein B7C54_10390 [Acidimicrobiales bacterium mtb01]|nr:DUF222 domain-containing protein [Actinomycetota bacterium]TEX45481.1 MAG: hypothetical protein B7C54_10390 [Acidimicrobiales bacterium mtb01]